MYGDKCKHAGQTLYRCKMCQCVFHHLCSSQLGNSDDMNLCRENCDGKQLFPRKPLKLPKPHQLSEEAGAFVPNPDGASLEDDDSDPDTAKHDKDDHSHSQSPMTPRRSSDYDDEDVSVVADNAKLRAKEEEKLKKRENDAIEQLERRHQKRMEAEKARTKDDLKALDLPGKRTSVRQSQEVNKSDKDHSLLKTSGKTPRKQPRLPVPVPSHTSEPETALPDTNELVNQPRYYSVGGRPSVNPSRLEHRQMLMPLYAGEPVVFAEAENKPKQLGVVMSTIDDVTQPVYVLRMGVSGSTKGTRIGPFDLADNLVIKQTDYVVYCGQRYCVFGPPIGSFCGLAWGTSWLDLAGEQNHFKNLDLIDEHILFELQRLDVCMMKYGDIPEIPVLVLGFLQLRDDNYDWKCVGLVNFHDDDVLSSEAKAGAHICSITMSELKKEFANTLSCRVVDVADFSVTSHPTVMAYHSAMAYIYSWAKNNKHWYPRLSWKTKFAKLYPNKFRALTANEAVPKPCGKCEDMTKKLNKASVSPLHVCLLRHKLLLFQYDD